MSEPCYIIAEMSANHAGDIDRAIEIVRAAKDAGANCVKIQTYTPDTMTIPCDKDYFKIKGGLWDGNTLYDLYKQAYTPWEWHERIKSEVESLGMDFLSTPFDKSSVDFLEDLGVRFYKIASFEATDIPLIQYIAKKGKPIILSTGMCTLSEIDKAVTAIRNEGNQAITLLHCSSAYPAISGDMNLKNISHLRTVFQLPVGLSDHTLGTLTALAGVALGASVIEKHFCISRAIPNPDAAFSMEPHEFKDMVYQIREIEKAMGSVSYGPKASEKENLKYRRSIFVVKNIRQGERFNEENIRIIRPAAGLSPEYFPDILGMRAACDIELGTPLSWKLITE